MAPPSMLPAYSASTASMRASASASSTAERPSSRRPRSQCSLTGVCPTPTMKTSLIIFPMPRSMGSDFSAQPKVVAVARHLAAPGQVVLHFGTAAGRAGGGGQLEGESVASRPRAVGAKENPLAPLRHVQHRGEAEQRGAGVGVSHLARHQPNADLLLGKAERLGDPFGEFGDRLVEDR